MSKNVVRLAVGAAAVALVLTTSVPAQAAIRVIDRCHARGQYAICTASGSVDNPRRIWVKVKSTPTGQRAVGTWTMTCVKNSGAGSKSGRVRGTTPFRQRLAMNYADPDNCSVAANAQLSGKGSISVILLARVPG